MPVENATYISQLNPDWPVGKSDFVSEGDDHFRTMKSALQNTIPNADAPITGTPTQLNNLTNAVNWVDNSATAGAASYFEVTDPTSTADTPPDAPLVVGTPTVEQYNATPGLVVNWNLLTDVIYAVGKHFESETDSRNPADILGFGTWEQRSGLLYGVGTVSDKAQVDSDGNALTYTFAAGEVTGRLYVTQDNIQADTLTLKMDAVDPHVHEMMTGRNDTDEYHSGGSHKGHIGNGFSPSYNIGDTWMTSAGGHTPAGTVDYGTRTDPFLIPGYACYRWVRTA